MTTVSASTVPDQNSPLPHGPFSVNGPKTMLSAPAPYTYTSSPSASAKLRKCTPVPEAPELLMMSTITREPSALTNVCARVFGETLTGLLIPIWFGSSVSERASSCAKVTLGCFTSMCDPYRTLGTSVSARVRIPPFSLLVEIMPGNDTSGSGWGLLFGCVLGDANSIVSDADESRTNAIKLVMFIF